MLGIEVFALLALDIRIPIVNDGFLLANSIFLTTYFVLSLITSLSTSVLIIVRILMVHRWTHSFGDRRPLDRRYVKIIEMIVESAALYTHRTYCTCWAL